MLGLEGKGTCQVETQGLDHLHLISLCPHLSLRTRQGSQEGLHTCLGGQRDMSTGGCSLGEMEGSSETRQGAILPHSLPTSDRARQDAQGLAHHD